MKNIVYEVKECVDDHSLQLSEVSTEEQMELRHCSKKR